MTFSTEEEFRHYIMLYADARRIQRSVDRKAAFIEEVFSDKTRPADEIISITNKILQLSHAGNGEDLDQLIEKYRKGQPL